MPRNETSMNVLRILVIKYNWNGCARLFRGKHGNFLSQMSRRKLNRLDDRVGFFLFTSNLLIHRSWSGVRLSSTGLLHALEHRHWLMRVIKGIMSRSYLILWTSINFSYRIALWSQPNTRMLVTLCICLKQYFDTRYLVFYNTSPPRMFLSLDLLWEYRIQHGATDPFMSHLATQLGYSAGEFQALQLIVLATFGVVD